MMCSLVSLDVQRQVLCGSLGMHQHMYCERQVCGAGIDLYALCVWRVRSHLALLQMVAANILWPRSSPREFGSG